MWRVGGVLAVTAPQAENPIAPFLEEENCSFLQPHWRPSVHSGAKKSDHADQQEAILFLTWQWWLSSPLVLCSGH